MKIERIKQLVEMAKDLPKAVIEYSGELPDLKGIKEDSFYGVKAVYNKNVPKSVGCNLVNKY